MRTSHRTLSRIFALVAPVAATLMAMAWVLLSPPRVLAAQAQPFVATEKSNQQTLPVVVIDPGHGGEQLGAEGVCGVPEKSIALAIGAETAALLRHSGAAWPLLTRSTDVAVPLEARAQLANHASARLFVSIHANASLSHRVRGVETFFLSHRAANKRLQVLADRENEGALPQAPAKQTVLQRIMAGLVLNEVHQESQRLAMRLHRHLTPLADERERGRGVLQAPLVVLREARIPAALVEVGFLTHPEECQALTTTAHQRRVARAIAAGILDHLRRNADRTVPAHVRGPSS